VQLDTRRQLLRPGNQHEGQHAQDNAKANESTQRSPAAFGGYQDKKKDIAIMVVMNISS
jgi:hypothetical protein